MSDLPNWINAVDKSSEVTDEELKEINELTNKLKQSIREKNVEKIKTQFGTAFNGGTADCKRRACIYRVC